MSALHLLFGTSTVSPKGSIYMAIVFLPTLRMSGKKLWLNKRPIFISIQANI
ncbi:hypothetical protein LINGRAHAP2_LOCUS19574 [Linum grandiflorum]